MYKVNNAIILAAGLSSRFVPLSLEVPKGLVEVHGEVLIERQIRQLRASGVPDIFVVVGYKAKAYDYLQKLGVKLIFNPYYKERNNHSSIWVAKNIIQNTYICSVDNYFLKNPFHAEEKHAYYSAVFARGVTNEWCMQHDESHKITGITKGGRDSFVMLGHAFWSETFSQTFLKKLADEFHKPQTQSKFWEDIYIDHIESLPMYMNILPSLEENGQKPLSILQEFDSLDELRVFDKSYINHTRSAILSRIAKALHCEEKDLFQFSPKVEGGSIIAFTFAKQGTPLKRYSYNVKTSEILEMNV